MPRGAPDRAHPPHRRSVARQHLAQHLASCSKRPAASSRARKRATRSGPSTRSPGSTRSSMNSSSAIASSMPGVSKSPPPARRRPSGAGPRRGGWCRRNRRPRRSPRRARACATARFCRCWCGRPRPRAGCRSSGLVSPFQPAARGARVRQRRRLAQPIPARPLRHWRSRPACSAAASTPASQMRVACA